MNKILVSSCLLGTPCRYDGKSKPCTHPLFLRWMEEGRLIAVCPEVEGGLPTPRTPCERCGNQVISRNGENRTAEYFRGAELALEAARLNEVQLCVLKEGSPSCGANRIYDGSFTGKKLHGEGVTAELLRKHGFRVISEEELDSLL